MRYCACVSTNQNATKCHNIAEQNCARVASRKNDAKRYIAKASPNVDDIYLSSQDGLQDTLLASLPKPALFSPLG